MHAKQSLYHYISPRIIASINLAGNLDMTRKMTLHVNNHYELLSMNFIALPSTLHWYSYKQFFLTIRDAVQDFLHEIYFLPDHPELEKIKAVLQEYRKVFHFFIFSMEDLEYKIVPDSSILKKVLTIKAGCVGSCI